MTEPKGLEGKLETVLYVVNDGGDYDIKDYKGCFIWETRRKQKLKVLPLLRHQAEQASELLQRIDKLDEYRKESKDRFRTNCECDGIFLFLGGLYDLLAPKSTKEKIDKDLVNKLGIGINYSRYIMDADINEYTRMYRVDQLFPMFSNSDLSYEERKQEFSQFWSSMSSRARNRFFKKISICMEEAIDRLEIEYKTLVDHPGHITLVTIDTWFSSNPQLYKSGDILSNFHAEKFLEQTQK